MNNSFDYLKMTGQHTPEWVGQYSRNLQPMAEIDM